MKGRTIMRVRLSFNRAWLQSSLTCLLFLLAHSIVAKDFKASIAHIPMLAETSDKGAFIDLTKALDNVYEEGSFAIKVYPMGRSLNNVVNGRADFHIPMIRSPYVDINTLPYRFAERKMGTVCFVIYSHKNNPITREMILNDANTSVFPYKIETLRGMKDLLQFPFAIKESSQIEQSLRNIAKKRVDALIFAQEETDFVLRKLNLASIHRSLFACWDDVIVIPKGEKGEAVDKVISSALQTLDDNGTLVELRKKIHVPFIDWQP